MSARTSPRCRRPAIRSSDSNIVFLYAVKHNPFAYFASVQEGRDRALSLDRVVSFEGQHGLYADLKTGHVPDLAFIAPNQCNDQHGRGNGTAFCNFDADDNGTQTGLNPTLILQGDLTVQRIVTAIKASPVWSESRSAIVILWDENDYSRITSNQVVTIVDTNYGEHRMQSAQVLRSLLADEDIGRGFQASLPQSCVRCGRRGDGGLVSGIRSNGNHGRRLSCLP